MQVVYLKRSADQEKQHADDLIDVDRSASLRLWERFFSTSILLNLEGRSQDHNLHDLNWKIFS